MHWKSFAQSVAAAHDVRHPLASQVYGTQEVSICSAHVPAEVQLAAAKNLSLSQRAARHSVAAGFLKPTHWVVSFAPSQVLLAQMSVDSAHAARVPCGAPLIGRHFPFSVESHASHCPEHADSQHTPSTHCFEPHWSPSVHVAPRIFRHVPRLPSSAHDSAGPHAAEPQHTPSVQNRPAPHSAPDVHGSPRPTAGTHVDSLQKFPVAQSVVTVQLVLQAVGPHAYTPQDFGASLHAPAPSHVLAWVSMPPEHPVPLHAMVSAGA